MSMFVVKLRLIDYFSVFWSSDWIFFVEFCPSKLPKLQWSRSSSTCDFLHATGFTSVSRSLIPCPVERQKERHTGLQRKQIFTFVIRKVSNVMRIQFPLETRGRVNSWYSSLKVAKTSSEFLKLSKRNGRKHKICFKCLKYVNGFMVHVVINRRFFKLNCLLGRCSQSTVNRPSCFHNLDISNNMSRFEFSWVESGIQCHDFVRDAHVNERKPKKVSMLGLGRFVECRRNPTMRNLRFWWISNPCTDPTQLLYYVLY